MHAHPSLVLDVLENALLEAGEGTQRVDGPAVRFYAQNQLVLDDKGHRHLSVRSGGSNPHPFVECKGRVSPLIAGALRENFSHSPSRIDSSVDRQAPGLMQDLARLAGEFEAQFGLKLNMAGAKLDNPDRGTTVYLGSRQSQVFVRIYQKGLKLAEELQLAPDQITDELRNWVRIELEFKPQKKAARKAATKLSPLDVWGASPWTTKFAMDALSMEAERVNVSERRESDHERALRFMAHQYRSHLDKLLRDCRGDYAAAMAVLVELADLAPAEAA